jgi:hypothetical protein
MVKFSALSSGRLFRHLIFLILFSVRERVDPRGIGRPKGLGQWKTPMIPSGIKPAISELAAQYDS